jgi:hypothetical protein
MTMRRFAYIACAMMMLLVATPGQASRPPVAPDSRHATKETPFDIALRMLIATAPKDVSAPYAAFYADFPRVREMIEGMIDIDAVDGMIKDFERLAPYVKQCLPIQTEANAAAPKGATPSQLENAAALYDQESKCWVDTGEDALGDFAESAMMSANFARVRAQLKRALQELQVTRETRNSNARPARPKSVKPARAPHL